MECSDRLSCPFYAFVLSSGKLINSDENMCGALNEECQMELEGHEPDWSNCPRNTPGLRKRLEQVADKVKVYVTPVRIGSGKEVKSLREWMMYSLGEELQA